MGSEMCIRDRSSCDHANPTGAQQLSGSNAEPANHDSDKAQHAGARGPRHALSTRYRRIKPKYRTRDNACEPGPWNNDLGSRGKSVERVGALRPKSGHRPDSREYGNDFGRASPDSVRCLRPDLSSACRHPDWARTANGGHQRRPANRPPTITGEQLRV